MTQTIKNTEFYVCPEGFYYIGSLAGDISCSKVAWRIVHTTYTLR
jgi:hypothetical protein